MADILVTNTSGGSTITGTPADRLVVTYTVDGGVTLTGFTGSLATGYSGSFDGPGSTTTSTSRASAPSRSPTLATASTTSPPATATTPFTTGADNDIIHSGGGIDVVDGGDGIDRWGADMSFATDDIVIDLNGSSTFLGTGSVVNVEGFDGLTTGSGNDR